MQRYINKGRRKGNKLPYKIINEVKETNRQREIEYANWVFNFFLRKTFYDDFFKNCRRIINLFYFFKKNSKIIL